MIFVLIDNDADDLENLELALKKSDEDAECTGFVFADEALRLLKRGAIIPDYIFIDVNMPRLSGMDCLDQINKEPSLHGTYVIMYSGVMPVAVGEAFKQRGAKGYFQKPSKDQEYIRIIQELIHPSPSIAQIVAMR